MDQEAVVGIILQVFHNVEVSQMKVRQEKQMADLELPRVERTQLATTGVLPKMNILHQNHQEVEEVHKEMVQHRDKVQRIVMVLHRVLL